MDQLTTIMNQLVMFKDKMMSQLLIIKNEIMSVLPLYSDLVAFFAAASVLSLFAGWMIKRSSAKRKLKKTVEGWEKRYAALEHSAAADTENLEEQLQNLANETRTLQSSNRTLTESLKKNDTSIQKARAEAIELNRQYAETQERMQRIMQQKDRELADLGNRMNKVKQQQPSSGSTHIAPNAASVLHGHASRLQDTELNHADTVAINPVEMFDATVQMSAREFVAKDQPQKARRLPENNDLLEDTADLSGIMEEELEESTVALDEESLAFAQRSYPSGRRD